MWYASTMRILPCVLLALCLQSPAKADKFWLSDPAAPNATEGMSPNVIEGVLIAESDEGYHVRIVGGEILLPKKAVFRIEKDGLSVDSIVKLEQQQAEHAAAAQEERASAPAPRHRNRSAGKATDAAASRRDTNAESAPASFDPIVGREMAPAIGPAPMDLHAEIQLAWTMTKDKRYLKMLRQLRRLR